VARGRGPVLRRRGRSRERANDHQGDDRHPSRNHRRAPEGRVQGRGQHRRAADRPSRDHLALSPRRFARIKIWLEPLPRGSGYSFENGVIGETVPTEHARTLEKRTQGDGLGEKTRQRAWPSSPSTGLHKNRVVLHRGGAQALGLSRWVGRDYRGSYKRIHRLACGGFTAHLQSGGLRARPSHFALKSSLGD